MQAKTLAESHAIVFSTNGMIFVGALELCSTLSETVELHDVCQIVQDRHGRMSLANAMLPCKTATIRPAILIRLGDLLDNGQFTKLLEQFYAARNSGIVIAK